MHRPGVPHRVLHGQGRLAARREGSSSSSILLPLWASYLVKAYAWRLILQRGRHPQLDPRAGRPQGAGLRRRRGLARLHLPVAAVHDPADLRRARADPELAARGVGRPRRPRLAHTFRKVILPLALPAVVAGSIFTFSLTLGDYIVPSLVSSSQFIGNVVYSNICRQPAAGRGVRARPAGDHARLPRRRAASRRLRGALMPSGRRLDGSPCASRPGSPWPSSTSRSA